MYHGPLAPSGKPHGEWTVILWKPQDYSTFLWYWYGDQISEGEWHRLNAGG
jgi:hypothetical protein